MTSKQALFTNQYDYLINVILTNMSHIINFKEINAELKSEL